MHQERSEFSLTWLETGAAMAMTSNCLGLTIFMDSYLELTEERDAGVEVTIEAAVAEIPGSSTAGQHEISLFRGVAELSANSLILSAKLRNRHARPGPLPRFQNRHFGIPANIVRYS